MESHLLPLKAGWRWFFEGWKLIKKSPVLFLIGTGIWLGLELVLGFIPVAGPMLDGFVFPIMYAGFLSFVSHVDKGAAQSIKDFFVPFFKPALLMQLAVLGLIIAGFEILTLTFARTMGSIAVAVLVPLTVIMVSALIFSVPLMLFHQEKFHLALRSSVEACAKNFAVMIVMYFILMGFMVISAITFGIGLVIIIPLTFCGLYLGYRQTFQK